MNTALKSAFNVLKKKNISKCSYLNLCISFALCVAQIYIFSLPLSLSLSLSLSLRKGFLRLNSCYIKDRIGAILKALKMRHLILLTVLSAVALCHQPFQVIFEWKSIEFVWPSEEDQQYALLRGDYIPANIFPSTVKFWKDKMYITIPRWRDGVPVTLGRTSAKPMNGVTAPKLEAFPNWSKQKLGDCSAFQLVHSIEIDPKGRMWVLDTGHTLSLREPKTICPARLVILDLEKDGEILRTYEFPDDVAHRGNTYLNDIVLDHEDGGMAYITDNDSQDPGIIVYSLGKNTAWKVRHESMRAKSEAVGFKVANMNVINPVHVDGIALSPASSHDRYSVKLRCFPVRDIHVREINR